MIANIIFIPATFFKINCLQKLTIRIFKVVRALVNRIETLVVVHLPEAKINRDLYGLLWILRNQYNVGTFLLIAKYNL